MHCKCTSVVCWVKHLAAQGAPDKLANDGNSSGQEVEKFAGTADGPEKEMTPRRIRFSPAFGTLPMYPGDIIPGREEEIDE